MQEWICFPLHLSLIILQLFFVFFACESCWGLCSGSLARKLPRVGDLAHSWQEIKVLAMFAEPLNLRGVVREVISGISQKCFKRKLASGKFGLWEFLKGFAPQEKT